MKVAVIGSGNVGMATYSQLLQMPEVHKLALVGRESSLKKLRGEVEDFCDALVLRPGPAPELIYGGYEKCRDADIIIYTAGVAQKPDQSRLELVDANIKIVRSIFSEINEYNTDAIVVCLSNPVDIITAAVCEFTGRPRAKVIGSGTLLDTARLIKYIARMLDISPRSVNVFVLGEHGDSSCAVWSSLRILGMTIDEYVSCELGESTCVSRSKLSQIMRKAAGKLISEKGFTAYGVASAACRIVSAIVSDSHEILPLSTVLHGEYGLNGIAMSVPCILGKNGIISVRNMNLTQEECANLKGSAAIIADTAAKAGLNIIKGV